MSIKDFNIGAGLTVNVENSSVKGSLSYSYGSPEGVVSAKPDTICFDLLNNLIYKKQTGKNKLGWVLFNGDTDMTLTKRVNNNGDYIYIGEAAVGSVDSDSVWRISRTYISPIDGDIIILWANGTSNFDKVWNNHLSLSYS